MNRDRIVRRARQICRERGWIDPQGYGDCLYAAIAVQSALSNVERCVIQAGSACWQRIPPEQDDGVINTHFGYEWEPESAATRQAIIEDRLPELHVWAAIASTGEVIDITTARWPELCLKSIGADWPGERPPDYLWAKQVPERARYTPSKSAISVALAYWYRLKYQNWVVQ